MIKQLVLLSVFILSAFGMFAQTSQNDITGIWENKKGRLLKIYEENGKYHGIGVDESGNQIQEEPFLKDLNYEDGAWKGKFYFKKKKKDLDVECTLSSSEKMEVAFKFGKRSKSRDWTRK